MGLTTVSTKAAATVIDRASANDLMQRAADVGPVPMQVGAILLLDSGPTFDPADAREVLAARLVGVPRLRQKLVSTPFGCGRPLWVDDAAFALDHHVITRVCPSPGDDAAVLACAIEILGTRLAPDRPPWSATFVTGLADGGAALVIVFDHVLADGIGGLAVLANLVDGAAAPVGSGFPRPVPSSRAVAIDALVQRMRTVTRWRAGLHDVRAAVAELRLGRGSIAPRTSLNRPTGSVRAARTVVVGLDDVRSIAHGHGATVNDVMLVAVTEALHAVLHARGEEAERFVVSIPISARHDATSHALGNEVGVLPLDLPATGPLDVRLHDIARLTRARKDANDERGSSAVLVAPAFRLLARLGVLRWFLDHQRMINTLVTNLHGPDQPLAFGGAPLRAVIPISIVTGNVTIAFAVLSYAGALTITVDADAEACPDLDLVVDRLRDALASMGAAARTTAGISGRSAR